jgi:peroxiredoxin
MLRARVGAGLLAGCFLVWVGASEAAPPPAATMLKYHPKQENILISTPAEGDIPNCKVEAISGKTKGAGWLLRDASGRPLRRFFDSNFDGKAKTGIDVYSYYLEGEESYRELYVNTSAEPDQMQYRWLGAAGSKWGVDHAKNGKIDTWKAISPEEVSQEIVQALVKKDSARLLALMVTESDIATLALPKDIATRARSGRAAAEKKFSETVGKLTNLGEKTRWVHVELDAPRCLPAEQTGAQVDLMKHARGTILVETGGKNDFIQTGEMILVGAAWRILEAPVAGDGEANVGPQADPTVTAHLKSLTDLDTAWSKKTGQTPAEVVKYNLERADLIEKIVGVVKADDREQWIRQSADCLGAAAQMVTTEDAPYNRLVKMAEQLETTMPAGSALPGYVRYREVQADYSRKMSKEQKDFEKVQLEGLDRLAKYVTAYPALEETMDALLALGWGYESLGKDVEAKNSYKRLVTGFAGKPQADKAKGALERLDLDGKTLNLSAPTAAGTEFAVSSIRDKVVVVYFWMSNQGADAEFAKLKSLADTYAAKGLELVTVNLDSNADEAVAAVKKVTLPGTHLVAAGGMEGKLATDFGLTVPPYLFLVGKDGKVVSTKLLAVNVEGEVKKLLAK